MTIPSNTDEAQAIAYPRGLLRDAFLPPLGALGASGRNGQAVRFYDVLGGDAQTAQLYADLTCHLAKFGLKPFVAVFPGAVAASEPDFEAAMRSQLDHLAAVEGKPGLIASPASTDGDHHVSLHISGRRVCVTGLHPGASAAMRRAPYETLVFHAPPQSEASFATDRVQADPAPPDVCGL
ncbi:hypothetical protein [uncultured Algimonas sp.]|uniref:hypothetical protein n=1 Tax=uncultured Algimonas sp. TaxID=1547920 RepID=UPI00260E66AC|nr:hypothetical protein [uncultured Algimonas sp.]